MKLRHVLFSIDSKYKKNKKYAQDESDLEDDWIESHEDEMKAKEIEKAEKKFAKDNEKLVEEGKTAQKESVLREKIEDIEADFERLAKERGTCKASLKRERATEKIEQAIDKLDDRIKAFKLQIDDRDAGKEVALGTRCELFLSSSELSLIPPIVKSITWIHGESRVTEYWVSSHI